MKLSSFCIFGVQINGKFVFIGAHKPGSHKTLTQRAREYSGGKFYRLELLEDATDLECREFIAAYKYKYGLGPKKPFNAGPMNEKRLLMKVVETPKRTCREGVQQDCRKRAAKFCDIHAPGDPNGWWSYDENRITT